MGASKRGLASTDEETREEEGDMGGQGAQENSNAHELTDEERSRGGQNSPGNFANRDRSEVSEIGRKGGQSSHKDNNREEDEQ